MELVSLVNEAHKNGCRLKIACTDLGIDLKTFNRWQERLEDLRHGPKAIPKNKLTDEEKQKIIEIAASKEFVDLSPWLIVSRLADKGVYIASESSFYKVLRENKLLSHRGKTKIPCKNTLAPLIAKAPNQIWSWDITYLKSCVRGEFYFLYLVMDIFSRKIVGFNVYGKESMENASELIEISCKAEKISKEQLTLHSDNGGPMKGATMLATLQKLGVTPSFSRPKVSNDNPYSEALFKTLKYCPKYPEYFESIEEARRWCIMFVDWYNNQQHSGIKFVTPIEKHLGLDQKILINRHQVYEEVKAKNPLRWNNRATRNWNMIKEVYLNYLQKDKNKDIKMAS